MPGLVPRPCARHFTKITSLQPHLNLKGGILIIIILLMRKTEVQGRGGAGPGSCCREAVEQDTVPKALIQSHVPGLCVLARAEVAPCLSGTFPPPGTGPMCFTFRTYYSTAVLEGKVCYCPHFPLGAGRRLAQVTEKCAWEAVVCPTGSLHSQELTLREQSPCGTHPPAPTPLSLPRPCSSRAPAFCAAAQFSSRLAADRPLGAVSLAGLR